MEDYDSREELFDSSLDTVNVSVDTDPPMDFSFDPKEEDLISFITKEKSVMMNSIE